MITQRLDTGPVDILTENKNGAFVIPYLPSAGQIPPVEAIAAEDFDGDGSVDFALAGNNGGFRYPFRAT